MTKQILFAGLAALGLVAGANAAVPSCACPGSSQLTDSTSPTLSTALSGNTVCVSNGPDWEWQEQHRAGGDLWDYKRGSPHATDPTAHVGVWAVSGNGTNHIVTHTYTGAGPYNFKVFALGGPLYCFCPTSGGGGIQASIKSSIGGCP